MQFNNFSKEQIEALILACEFFYPQISSGKPYPRIESGDYGVPGIPGAKWNNYTEFDEWIGGTIKAYRLLQKKKIELSSPIEESATKEAPAAATPDKIQLDKLVEDFEKAKGEKEKEAALNAYEKELQRKKGVEARVVRKFTELGKIDAKDYKNKIVYAEPVGETPSVSLSETEKIAFEKLKEAAQTDPKIFIEKVSSEIRDNLPNKVSAALSKDDLSFSSKMVASDLAARLALETPVIPSGVFSSLATSDDFLNKVVGNAELGTFIKEGSFVFATVGNANEINIRSFLIPSYGSNFVDFIYGKEGSSFRFSVNPNENSVFEIDLQKIGEGFKSFQESNVFKLITSPFSDSLKSNITSEGQQALSSFLNNLPKNGFFTRLSSSSLTSQGLSLLSGFRGEYVATGAFGSFLKATFPEYLPLLHPLANWLGVNVGITALGTVSAPAAGAAIEGGLFRAGAIKSIQVSAGKVVSGAVGKIAGAVIGKTAGAAIGTAVGGVVGLAVGYLVGKVLGKAWDFLKEKIGKYKDFFLGATALGVIGVGLWLGMPLLIVVGGAALVFVTAGVFGFAPVAAFAVVGGAAWVVFFRILKETALSLSLLFLAIILAVPVLVAIILFIINSGAYVVPPKTSLLPGIIESPYIDVTKTIDGTNEFENDALPVDVTYKIEVRAKKGTLTNIKFDYQCKVVRDGREPNCPDTDLPPPPKIISPTESFSFTYTHQYDNAFSDSLVIDTITITADAPDAKGAEAAASASVRIGSPPEECPSEWPLASSGGLTQGANGSDTHSGTEAIDISVSEGNPIKATHTGIVRAFATDDGPYGKHVEIESVCDGKPFFSRYAHLSVVGVKTGQTATLGGDLGLSGNTGNSTGAHLHYEFRYPTGPTGYPQNPPYMNPPYIPKVLPRNCSIDTPPSCGRVPIP